MNIFSTSIDRRLSDLGKYVSTLLLPYLRMNVSNIPGFMVLFMSLWPHFSKRTVLGAVITIFIHSQSFSISWLHIWGIFCQDLKVFICGCDVALIQWRMRSQVIPTLLLWQLLVLKLIMCCQGMFVGRPQL